MTTPPRRVRRSKPLDEITLALIKAISQMRATDEQMLEDAQQNNYENYLVVGKVEEESP